MTFAKESGSFFPSGLVKHFELQSCLASIAALHFEGQALAANEESTRSLMNSFQLEESDRVSAEATLAAAKADVQQFYKIYRIYVGFLMRE